MIIFDVILIGVIVFFAYGVDSTSSLGKLTPLSSVKSPNLLYAVRSRFYEQIPGVLFVTAREAGLSVWHQTPGSMEMIAWYNGSLCCEGQDLDTSGRFLVLVDICKAELIALDLKKQGLAGPLPVAWKLQLDAPALHIRWFTDMGHKAPDVGHEAREQQQHLVVSNPGKLWNAEKVNWVPPPKAMRRWPDGITLVSIDSIGINRNGSKIDQKPFVGYHFSPGNVNGTESVTLFNFRGENRVMIGGWGKNSISLDTIRLKSQRAVLLNKQSDENYKELVGELMNSTTALLSNWGSPGGVIRFDLSSGIPVKSGVLTSNELSVANRVHFDRPLCKLLIGCQFAFVPLEVFPGKLAVIDVRHGALALAAPPFAIGNNAKATLYDVAVFNNIVHAVTSDGVLNTFQWSEF